ncbi:MAG TPA: PilZ domain-containing protein [Terriglobales bacterium]|nr:PilZ domain-containing protein [Terriglobales bacterium]
MQWLMLSRDEQLVAALRRTASEMQLEVRLCDAAGAAHQELQERRYEAVVVDCDDTQAGASVLKSVRQTALNQSSLLVAVLHGTTSSAEAVGMGANCILRKPLSFDAVRREMRRAYAMLGQDQRRHSRFPFPVPVHVTCGGTSRSAIAFNLSEGGIGVCLADPIVEDEMVRVRFQLPGWTAPIQAMGEIAWADAEGRAGIRFTSISEAARTGLRRWVMLRAQAGN